MSTPNARRYKKSANGPDWCVNKSAHRQQVPSHESHESHWSHHRSFEALASDFCELRDRSDALASPLLPPGEVASTDGYGGVGLGGAFRSVSDCGAGIGILLGVGCAARAAISPLRLRKGAGL
jgi:hypothetical protein